MAVLDYERAWLAMKKVIAAKASHGRRDLLAEITRIEIESELAESPRVAPLRSVESSKAL